MSGEDTKSPLSENTDGRTDAGEAVHVLQQQEPSAPGTTPVTVSNHNHDNPYDNHQQIDSQSNNNTEPCNHPLNISEAPLDTSVRVENTSLATDIDATQSNTQIDATSHDLIDTFATTTSMVSERDNDAEVTAEMVASTDHGLETENESLHSTNIVGDTTASNVLMDLSIQQNTMKDDNQEPIIAQSPDILDPQGTLHPSTHHDDNLQHKEDSQHHKISQNEVQDIKDDIATSNDSSDQNDRSPAATPSQLPTAEQDSIDQEAFFTPDMSHRTNEQSPMTDAIEHHDALDQANTEPSPRPSEAMTNSYPKITTSSSNDTNLSDINTIDHTSGEEIRLRDRVEFLEMELAKAESMVESLQTQNQQLDSSNDEVLIALQNNLEQQMNQKAEAENKCRLLEQQLEKLKVSQHDQSQEMEQLRSLQANLETQMSAKAEAENKVRLANDRIQALEAEQSDKQLQLDHLQEDFRALQMTNSQQEQELEKLRAQRDEQERKEIALTNRLNAVKKKEANEANLTEAFEDEIKVAKQAAEIAIQELEQVRQEKMALENQLASIRGDTDNKLHLLEVSLTEERKLNDERKKKMKAFIESKTEEFLQTRAEVESLQHELNESNKSLMELNTRWKQLHAQWMQAQTRNRELQRDLSKIKQDSEKMHRQGDTLEMKLSKSATEAEDHKNKRLAAKHELMSVLRQLEAEQELTRKLRDSLKFTFTPKALSQQQLLSEYMDDFEAQLSRLSRRLGKALPSVEEAGETTLQSATSDEDIILESGDNRRSDVDIQRLISKLEYETQKVSQRIMNFANGIERMHQLLDTGGDRSCFTALQEILATGSVAAASTTESTPMTGGLRSIRSHSYGHVPSSTR